MRETGEIAREWRPSGWHRDVAAIGAIGLAYLTLFALTRDGPASDMLEATARNVGSLALATALIRPPARRVLAWPAGRQAAAHVLLGAGFSLGWLWLLTVAGALLGAESALRFTVAPFLFGPAAAWQLLQGLFVYGLIAALLALDARPAAMASLIVLDDRAGLPPDRFLVRAGEEIAPLPASAIVSITGADDYAQVTTTDGTLLVQTRLIDFEQKLDPARFLRVHRSAIVNLDRLVRAEPAGGGRMTLRMESGADVPASRAGARLLRERLL